MLKDFYGDKHLITSSLLFLMIALFLVFFNREAHSMPEDAYFFTSFWLIISIACTFYSYKYFASGLLLTLFSMLISWRITQIYNINLLSIPYFMAFICLLCNFFYCAYLNLKNPQDFIHKLPLYAWQLVFIRLYLGFDFVPHFTEKLFAGPEPHLQAVKDFISIQTPYASFLVWLAGICEFLITIAISIGFMMRLGAFLAVLYLLIATYLGNHFALGFIWSNHGGGWEFAIMWAILISSFAFTGISDFTIDQKLKDKFSWYK